MKTIDIDDFNGINVDILYEEILEKYARRCATLLKTASPKSFRPNRATPYSTGWEVTPKRLKYGLRETVWNRTNWQLTHLLENGHWISNSAHPRITWSPPQKHIKPSYDMIRRPFIRDMKKVKIEANFK